jgi:CRISPR-associated protein Cas1
VGFHTVTVDAADCFLGCKSAQLICRTDEGERSLPLEDVASIVVTGFSGTVHSELLLECAERGIPLIFCRTYRPSALVYPANRSTDTLLTRAVLRLSPAIKGTLWRTTLDAKCLGQWMAAREYRADPADLVPMEAMARGKNPAREAVVARTYWGLWGASAGLGKFRRERSLDGANQLLNYGYAVLLSCVLQKLFSVGIDPSFGICHAVRERSDPLAYDLMEPFRVLVDRRVREWILNLEGKDCLVDKEFRAHVIRFLKDSVEYQGRPMETSFCVEAVVRSFRGAILRGKPSLYRPWTFTR